MAVNVAHLAAVAVHHTAEEGRAERARRRPQDDLRLRSGVRHGAHRVNSSRVQNNQRKSSQILRKEALQDSIRHQRVPRLKLSVLLVR